MTTSKRIAERKIERFEKRKGSSKKGYSYPVGPMVLGLLAFVIVGSYIFQMIRAAKMAA